MLGVKNVWVFTTVVVVGPAVVVVAGAAELDGVEFVDTALATHFNFPDTFLHTSGFLSVPDFEPIFLQVPPALAAETAENGKPKNNKEALRPTVNKYFDFII
jgi:hypothetical protein